LNEKYVGELRSEYCGVWKVVGAMRCILWVCIRGESETNLSVSKVFEKVKNEIGDRCFGQRWFYGNDWCHCYV